jgi:hypothetical protein
VNLRRRGEKTPQFHVIARVPNARTRTAVKPPSAAPGETNLEAERQVAPRIVRRARRLLRARGVAASNRRVVTRATVLAGVSRKPLEIR